MMMIMAFAQGAPHSVEGVGISYMLYGDKPVENVKPFDDYKENPDMGSGAWIEEGPHIMIVALQEVCPPVMSICH